MDTSRILSSILTSIQPPKVSDAQLLQLEFLLPQELITAALEIVDREEVIKSALPSGLAIFKIASSTSTPLKPIFYLPSFHPYPSAHLSCCTCPSFTFHHIYRPSLLPRLPSSEGDDPPPREEHLAGAVVVGREHSVRLCKHLLAAVIADRTGRWVDEALLDKDGDGVLRFWQGLLGGDD